MDAMHAVCPFLHYGRYRTDLGNPSCMTGSSNEYAVKDGATKASSNGYAVKDGEEQERTPCMQDIPSFLREATNEIRVKVSSKSKCLVQVT